MQLRSSTQQQPKIPIVKVHPSLNAAYQTRKRQRVVLIVLALLILLLYFLSIMPGVVQELAALAFFLSLFFLNAEVIVLILFVRGSNRIERLKGENQRRQSAAYAHYAESHEDYTMLPLVIPQPSVDIAALPLPTVIHSRPHTWILLVGMSLFLSSTILIITLLLWLDYWATSVRFPLFYQILDLPTLIIEVIVTFLILGIPFMWLVGRTLPVKLEITEEGLTLHKQHSKKDSFIPWSEARLFAIENYPGRSPQRSPRFFYELASEKHAIFWLQSSEENRSSISDAQGKRIQPKEYQQMVQASLSTIVAKTHLPLYDLR